MRDVSIVHRRSVLTGCCYQRLLGEKESRSRDLDGEIGGDSRSAAAAAGWESRLVSVGFQQAARITITRFDIHRVRGNLIGCRGSIEQRVARRQIAIGNFLDSSWVFIDYAKTSRGI